MLANGITGTGISAHKRKDDLSDFADELDMIEALGVEVDRTADLRHGHRGWRQRSGSRSSKR